MTCRSLAAVLVLSGCALTVSTGASVDAASMVDRGIASDVPMLDATVPSDRGALDAREIQADRPESLYCQQPPAWNRTGPQLPLRDHVRWVGGSWLFFTRRDLAVISLPLGLATRFAQEVFPYSLERLEREGLRATFHGPFIRHHAMDGAVNIGCPYAMADVRDRAYGLSFLRSDGVVACVGDCRGVDPDCEEREVAGEFGDPVLRPRQFLTGPNVVACDSEAVFSADGEHRRIMHARAPPETLQRVDQDPPFEFQAQPWLQGVRTVLGPVDINNPVGSILRSDGTVWEWGRGYCFHDRTPRVFTTFEPLPGLTDAVQLVGTGCTGMALRRNGQVVIWVNNRFPERIPQRAPLPVTPVPGLDDITELLSADCGRRRNGETVCWDGAFAPGEPWPRVLPVHRDAVQVAMNRNEPDRHAFCWVRPDDSLWCIGRADRFAAHLINPSIRHDQYLTEPFRLPVEQVP
jgi:hypothetical protein